VLRIRIRIRIWIRSTRNRPLISTVFLFFVTFNL
jgi:hypothetical protein